ncbi:nicotinate-nucleotide--dimethylbenzimidazole phosphoribosyltransferase [Streptomyces sp. NPDC059169]|uniref:nicotinate-nucleotide--dimethylbenzimidazole phosphoribosyltransferase n=1 Tax=Streptomyces sp. NPDC059169 TaxID=3346754 RepID=UPI003679083A
MTDTGQVPGEGLPENAGMVEQPGIPAPGAYTFLDPSGSGAESLGDDDDLLLMPGSQGAWSDPQLAPAPTAAPVPPPADGTAPAGPVPAPADVQAVPQAPAPVTGPAAPVGGPQEQPPAAEAPTPVPAPGEYAAPAQPVAAHGPLQHGQAHPESTTPPLQPGADQPATPAHGSATPTAAVRPTPEPAASVPHLPRQQAAHQTHPMHETAHESGGRDSGSIDLGGVRAASASGAAPTSPPSRRPLHMGPPLPDATGGVVRSLADRGPAARRAAGAGHVTPPPVPVSVPGPATSGPEYLDVIHEEPPVLPGPQLGEIAPQSAVPWAPQPPQSHASAVIPPAPAAPAGPSVPAETVVPEVPEVPEVSEVQGVAVATRAGERLGTGPAANPAASAAVDLPEAAESPQEAAPQPAPPARAAETPAAVEPAAPDPEAAAPTAPEPMAAAAPEPVAAPEPARETPEAEPEAAPVAEGPAAPQSASEAAVTVPAVPAPRDGTSGDGPAAVHAAAAGPQAAALAGEAEATPGTHGEQLATAAQEGAEPVAAEAAPELPEPQTAEVPPGSAGPQTAGAVPPDSEGGPSEGGGVPASPGEAVAADATGARAPGYAEAEREAVLRVMRERRDIRNGFRSDPIPHEVLLRVLEAAHTAPSVGHSQPWDFVVIRSAETRRTMHELAQRQREAYAKSLPKGRAKQFKELKIEAILDTPVNIVVTADPTRGGRHTLGRHTQPQMAPYSSALAVENLWLAARAEGLGVGWVSFFDEREMVRALGLPEHLEVVAYLCVGYVDEFPEEPELMQAGWSKRRPLSWVVHEETYGRRALPGEEPHDLLQETVSNIRPLDAKALGEAWERQKRMTKPAGALGMLEIISAQLSGLSRMCPPPIPEPAAVAIFAGDHGVHAQGVTAWPQEVTGQMVANFLGGGAVCNAFANQVGAEVCVIDVGVASDLPATPGLLPRKVRPGTADFTTGPALSRDEVLAAVEVGIETARDLVAAGNKALLTGEMGIANTTASAALIAVYTGVDPAEVTGRGTGINDEMHARKVDVVRRALELHQPDPVDPIGVLAAVGGLEHAALVGFILGGASLRTPVVLDGVSAGAAALVARAVAPEALAACIAGHRSAEPGHVAALNKLGLRPLVDLDLRLGEGTGALLALPLVQSAARAMHEVATFDSAGVTEK